MTEIRLDPYVTRYARRAAGMSASEIRALFSVASRPEIVSLAGGMPYTAALDLEAVADLTARLLRDDGAAALQYGGGQGSPELRERLCEVMAAEGVAASAEDLVVTTGGQQGLDLVGKLLLDPGDLLLAEGPSYVGALSAFSTYEAEVVHLQMDDDGLDPAMVDEEVTRLAGQGRAPKLLYTVPCHQNPAGVSLSEERRERLAEVVTRHDLLVLEDNPYGLLDFKGETRTALRSLVPERTIYLGTLSKIFAPGVRVGWVLAPPALREKLVQLKEAADLCQSNLTQAVAERWLATQPWDEQLADYREVYRARCEAMLAELGAEMPEGVSWSVPRGGFFVWLRLPEQLDAGEMLSKALGARVAYVPGRGFYADGQGSDAMRLSFCFPQVDDIRLGVRRLGEVVRDELELAAAVYGRR